MLLAFIVIIVDILTCVMAGMYYDNNLLHNGYDWHPAAVLIGVFVGFVTVQWIAVHYLPKTTVIGTLVAFVWMLHLTPGCVIC